jgi:3-oxoacyl-[acyl-carrier-protein] synthase II
MTTASVAVTGLGAVTPLGADVAELWQGLLAGRSGVRRIDDLLDGCGLDLPVRIAAPMAEEPLAAFPRPQARRMDRCQQAALAAARQAWAGAGAPGVDPDRLAVVVATGVGGVTTLVEQEHVLREQGPRKVSPFTVIRLMPNGPAAWISIEFGARAGVYTPISACSSGAEALALGARLIRAGEADVVIAGGAEAPIMPLTIAAFAQAGALSKRNDEPERASRPFDVGRDGFVLGEGAGVMILEREEFAAARGAAVLGHLAGYGITADAHHITAPDPEAAGQIRAMRKAVADAGLSPADIGHVNCHATATPVGDPGEAVAIRAALGGDVVLTAPKSSFGHLFGAAGAVEAITALLAVANRVVPPTLNLDAKDPAVTLDVVTGSPRPHPPGAALSNSFGFGGQNVCLVLSAEQA